jgi:type I restriction enzyme, S subunit
VFSKTREQWGALSNMAAGFPLVVVGEEWLTAEALYQACRFPDLPDVQKLILEERSPMAAKMKSKPHRASTRGDWEVVRTKIMRWVLRVKLAQHYRRFSAVLLETGDLPIVERSRKDRFWGAVEDADGVLRGANALGRLLMELRAELLRRDAQQGLLQVHPPAVENFLLLSRAVGLVSDRDQPTYKARFL